jgi:hypothetical protein
VKQKVTLKNKKLGRQINGNFNDVSSADEKKNITVETLLKTIKR